MISFLLLVSCASVLAQNNGDINRFYYGSIQDLKQAPPPNADVYMSGEEEVPQIVPQMPPNPYEPSTLAPPVAYPQTTTPPPQVYQIPVAATTTPPPPPPKYAPVTTPTIAVTVTTTTTRQAYMPTSPPTVGTVPTTEATWSARSVNGSAGWQVGGPYGDGGNDNGNAVTLGDGMESPYEDYGVYKYRYRPRGVGKIWRDKVLQNHRIHLLSQQSAWSSEEMEDKKRINWVMRPECLPEVLRNQKRYICTLTGQLICLGGWRGRFCHIPICHNDCGPNGQCIEPGKCRCRVGYDGDHCERCIPLPGCKYGTCQKNYECNCMRGWTGTFCSVPVCRRGCNLRHASCQFPGECNCNPGMYGYNCDQCMKAPGCVHGTCQKPFQCVCEPGWRGPNCDERICNVECNHGQCRTPDECECDIGWRGEKCDQCVPYPGCQNGYCTQPWECICNEGFFGFFCNMTAEMTTTPAPVGGGNGDGSGSGWGAYYSNYYNNLQNDSYAYRGGDVGGGSYGYGGYGDAGYDSYGMFHDGHGLTAPHAYNVNSGQGPEGYGPDDVVGSGRYGPDWETIDLDNPDSTTYNFTNIINDIIDQSNSYGGGQPAGGYYKVGPRPTTTTTPSPVGSGDGGYYNPPVQATPSTPRPY